MKSMDCNTCRTNLLELLDADGAASRPEVAAHLAACAHCRAELEELRATFALLDEWQAPEPTPYFDQRLHARLREAAAAKPEGLWERISSFVKFSTGRQFRPAMTGALAAVLLLAGSGTYFGLEGFGSKVAPSATVNDLKVLDNNAQVEQQLDQLLDNSNDDGGASPTS